MGNFQTKIDKFAELNDTDVIVYFGDIVRGRDDFIINECRKRKLRKNVLLVLATRGGDPNAGYRIARCLQEAYKTVDKTQKIKKTRNSRKRQETRRFFGIHR